MTPADGLSSAKRLVWRVAARHGAHLRKALVELSSDRAEFLSRLFSRRQPAGVEHASTTRALLDEYAVAVPDDTMFARNVLFVSDHLVKHHGFARSSGD